MDLSNLSPTSIDHAVMQRRPSLSSLSSASGYTSSSYGAAAVQDSPSGKGTPRLSNSRLAANSFGARAQNGWSNSNTTGANEEAAGDAGAWVEQQQQQQSTLLEAEGKHESVSGSSTPGHTSISISVAGDMDDDELIPTAIVIKNIPFAIKKEQLLEVMTKLSLPLPYAFNYHFDNGVFRGLAFANFTSTDETSLVVNQLNGREIGGRKLRVEYKKMLPLQERERIEREKREKRGQLEEQHRSTSNASLASLLSATSTTAATKNLSINGASQVSSERVFVNLPLHGATPPPELNFNDPEVLELHTQLVLYRDDVHKSIFELAISPTSMNLAQRKMLSVLCSFLGLLELFDNGLIIVRRKPGHISQSLIQQSSVLSQQAPPPPPPLPGVAFSAHSSSMMNLNQLAQLGSNGQPELLRSHSQSALPLPRLSRQQASTPIQQSFPQYQPQAQSQQQPQSQQSAQQNRYGSSLYQTSAQAQPAPTSAASILRSSNRSYVDIRSTPPISGNYQPGASATNSPTPQHSTHHPNFQGTQQFFQSSRPGTPLTNSDINQRFQPFGQHAHLSGSLTSLQQPQGEDGKERLASKFNGMNLGFEGGIWGPK